MTKKLRILMVEDSVADAELVEHELRKASVPFTLQRVDNEADFVAALKEYSPDIVLADCALPGFSGIEALTLLRQSFPEAPFIMLSGSVGEDTAAELTKK